MSFLPVEALAGGHKGLVEMRQGTGSLFDGLKIEGIAALQIVMGDGAQTVSRWSTGAQTNKDLLGHICKQ